MQRFISFAGYWRDPQNKDKYWEKSWFLAIANNENDVKDPEMKERFMSAEHIRLIKWKDETTIRPRESPQFGIFDEYYNTLPLQKRNLWKEDWIGLRQMSEEGRLTFATIPGDHMNYTHSTLDELVLPLIINNE